MKTIIAGPRDFPIEYALPFICDAANESGFDITEIVSGKAKGVDAAGKEFAKRNNIPVKAFPADWTTHGKRAGHIRNAEMADYAEALLAIWNGTSKGTKNMIDTATKKGLKVFVKIVEYIP